MKRLWCAYIPHQMWHISVYASLTANSDKIAPVKTGRENSFSMQFEFPKVAELWKSTFRQISDVGGPQIFSL